MVGETADPSDGYRILDVDGTLVDGEELPDLSDDELVGMYREMAFARHFDERAVKLQRRGGIGTYPPMAGQEGAQVGSAHALAEDDWVLYQYREHAVAFVRGVDPAHVLAYWQGKPAAQARLADANVFTITIPIGTHVPHAVGIAMASARTDESDRAVVSHFGDGATSEGDFHEGMNFAGVFDTPTVFHCHNNGWAISVPRERQTASATIAEKAAAYGFDGVRVDGMDPLAVYEVNREALDRARRPDPDGPRPTLIEADVYRYGPHTTADDPSRYREPEEVDRWRERDPITRLERFLLETGRLDEEAIDAIEVEVEERMDAAVERARSAPAPDPEEVFDDVFAERTPELRDQRDALMRHLDRHGSPERVDE